MRVFYLYVKRIDHAAGLMMMVASTVNVEEPIVSLAMQLNDDELEQYTQGSVLKISVEVIERGNLRA